MQHAGIRGLLRVVRGDERVLPGVREAVQAFAGVSAGATEPSAEDQEEHVLDSRARARLDVLNNTIVDGNLIINVKNGINIQNSYNVVSNNIVNTTYKDIMIYGEAENNTIIGNELLGKNFSLYQNSGAKNTLITSNKIYSKILLNGTYTIQYNSGYVTECSVEFINVVNGSWVPLMVKMSGAPQIVVTTLTTKGYAWVGNRNATHIQLFFNVPIASGSIYCEYIPTMFVEVPIIQHGLVIGVSGSGFTNPPRGTYLYDEGT